MGRVVSATFANGSTTTYTYDAAGNRTQVVTAALAPPVANPVSATVTSNSSNDPIALNITGGPASSVTVSAASHGTPTASGTSVTYTPNTGYSGADSFTYQAVNAAGTSTPATVSITVNAAVADGTVLVTQSTVGAFSYTIPAGVSFVDIEGWGSGYPGWTVNVLGTNIPEGGGGGAYFKKHISVTTGQVITGAITTPGVASATTITTPSLTANNGQSNAGGTATGGDTNTSGFSGNSPTLGNGGGAGNGGGTQTTAGAAGTAPGGGGAGPTGTGANGRIRITARTS